MNKPQITENTRIENLDFGACNGGDIVQKKTVSPIWAVTFLCFPQR